MCNRARAVTGGTLPHVAQHSFFKHDATSCNCVILLGPTACGKTGIGVALALRFNGEIISADSRQVYKGLDIGSGKDLSEYIVDGVAVPHHLIDIVDVSTEYNVYSYQQDFYRVFPEIVARRKLPVVVGGTGMYLDAIIRKYDLLTVPRNEALRAELEKKSLKELNALLLSLRPDLHTREDLRHKERCIKAIEIAECMRSPQADEIRSNMAPCPDIRPLVIGTTLEREELRERISKRLSERLDCGMIDEVACLHEEGASWQRLETLGLEYKFVAEYLQGKIATKTELYEKLNVAIRQFAKRQETWFRGMERKMEKLDIPIHWLPRIVDKEARVRAAAELIAEHVAHGRIGHFCAMT
ncbi:MAG: tRNA (adenosine(37)-N6)-dimethylallyltransferase MiaA [Treponema sp.]|nr:tRNA (adenosine(37)-N6)-dimethylallyltransferase MiaA [Treponema sp.]